MHENYSGHSFIIVSDFQQKKNGDNIGEGEPKTLNIKNTSVCYHSCYLESVRQVIWG